MIKVEKFWMFVIPLVILNCVIPFFLFPIYQDFLFAIVVPLTFGGFSCFAAAIFESVAFPTIFDSKLDEYNDLLSVGRIVVGVLFVFAFAGDDLLYQYNTVNEPWFWSAILSFISFWIVGIMLTRYRTFRNRGPRGAKATITLNDSETDEQPVNEKEE